MQNCVLKCYITVSPMTEKAFPFLEELIVLSCKTGEHLSVNYLSLKLNDE